MPGHARVVTAGRGVAIRRRGPSLAVGGYRHQEYQLSKRRFSKAHGYIAQWLERLTADQQVPGSNPGVPFVFANIQTENHSYVVE